MWLLTPYLQKVRNKMYTRYLKGDILDIGCGPASAIQYLNDTQKYYGIEFGQERVAKLKEKFPQENYQFFQRNLNTEPFDLGNVKVDTVIMIAFVEHIRNQDNLWNEINKYLKPGGRVVLTTPTVWGNYGLLNIMSKIGLTTKEAYREHCTIYTKNYLEMLCRDFGYQVVERKYFQVWGNQKVVLERV